MIIYGKNAVFEFIRSQPEDIYEIVLSDSSKYEYSKDLKEFIKTHDIKIINLPKEHISKICNNKNHQGILAKIKDFQYSDLQSILKEAKNSNQKLFLLILDHLEDPQNFGALIRTSEFLGVHGIIIPKDRSCEVSPSVFKVSSGAVRNIKIAKVTNLSRTIEDLKKQGIWIVGTDTGTRNFVFSEDLGDLDIAVVIGNEGRGMHLKIKEKCDFLLSIPQAGRTESLNASVAGGIFLYEIFRQRTEKG